MFISGSATLSTTMSDTKWRYHTLLFCSLYLFFIYLQIETPASVFPVSARMVAELPTTPLPPSQGVTVTGEALHRISILKQCCGSASRWCGSGFDFSPWCGCGSGFLFDPDPDQDFYLMWIRIRIFILGGSGSGFLFYADAGPDTTFHPDADTDPNPDPSLQVKAQILEKVPEK
jgi:hypothetical protein